MPIRMKIQINKLTLSPIASDWMFSSCLCSGSRADLSYEYLRLSVPFFPLFLFSLLSPALLSLRSPTPCLSSCLFACLEAASSRGQSGVAGCAAVLPPLSVCSPGPSRHSEPCGCSVSISRQELKWVTVPPGLEHRREDPRESSILLGQVAVVVTKL